MAVRFRGVTIPWEIELWLPRDFCEAEALEFRKLTKMAADAINAFEPPRGLKVRVLFDAGFLCPPVVAACRSRGFRWFSVAARNRNLRRRNKPDRKIGDLGPGCLKHQSRRIRLKRTGGRWRWMHVAALDGSLKKIGEVRIVFSKRINDPSGHQLAMATDETGLNPRDIVAIYESRWWIEVLLKELKGYLELGAYQMQSWCAITRYLHTVCLAHLTLTHHALSVLPTGKHNNAVGAPAKNGHQDLWLPGITERLADLRTASKRHRILKFLSRTKAPTRVKKRLQEFLMDT